MWSATAGRAKIITNFAECVILTDPLRGQLIACGSDYLASFNLPSSLSSTTH